MKSLFSVFMVSRLKREDEIILEGLDHLVTLPVFNWDNMKASFPMSKMYNALRSKVGASPLAGAAQKILDNSKRGDHVIITTGFYQISSKTYESDGPVGAASLARAVELATDAVPIILVADEFVDSMKKVCVASGLLSSDVTKAKDGIHRVGVGGFPLDNSAAKEASEKILSDVNPSCMLSVECPDHNSRDVYHRAKGYDVSSSQAKFPILFESGFRGNVFTLGIGDFGNEIGMAALQDAFAELVPSHQKCKCGCEAGILGITRTNSTIIANISNWGAYGLEAALALLTGNPEVMHDRDMEKRLLEASAAVGYVDGTTEYALPTADGASEEVNSMVVSLLRTLVELEKSKSFLDYMS